MVLGVTTVMDLVLDASNGQGQVKKVGEFIGVIIIFFAAYF